MQKRKMDFSRSTARLNIERILAALRKEDLLTPPELAQRVFLCEPQVRSYMKHMTAIELVHHPQWTREPVAGLRAFPRPQYRVGAGPSVARPRPLTAKAAARRHRRRVKTNPEDHYGSVLVQQRARLNRAMRSRHERVAKLREHGYPPELVYAAGSALRVGLQRRSPTIDQVGSIIQLRDAGKTWTEISQETGVARSTARTYYKRVAGGPD